MKKLTTLLTALLVLPLFISAQETKTKYSIGMRSTLITSDMNLAKLDAQFSDLGPDGQSGPHFSTIFFMVEYSSYFRYGFETFTANSDRKEQTTYDIQGAGLVAEFYYGKTFFVNTGVQIGAAIISAMAKDGSANKKDEVQNGTHYKSEGILFSPYISLGYKIGDFAPQFVYKPVFFGGTDDNSQIDLFDATYVGIGLSYNL